MKIKKSIITIVSFLFIFIFIYTAHSKIVDHYRFASTLSTSPLIGEQYARPIAWMIPASEIAIGFLLIIPSTRKIGLWLSLGLMIVFTAYLIFMVTSGLPKTCNCGGVISSMRWTQHIAFNFGLISLAACALYIDKIYENITKWNKIAIHKLTKKRNGPHWKY
ncbi:MauE/DoxX family redox-associated membrane protein [Chitinophaga sp. MM2321]|uniref:MauE/DoxX family redox-associated membrane protein n=1 Tax=Chitinophaga sp. MM2321 TaxID=3137178 RepID=UPI0032D595B7